MRSTLENLTSTALFEPIESDAAASLFAGVHFTLLGGTGQSDDTVVADYDVDARAY